MLKSWIHLQDSRLFLIFVLFPNKAYDISSHSHFTLNECKGENYLNSYIEIVECPVELAKLKALLADIERYKYIAQKQPSKYNAINLELLPNLFEEVEKLLLPDGYTFPIDKHSNFKEKPLLNSKQSINKISL